MLNRDALNELVEYTAFTWQTYANAVRQLPPDALTRPIEGSGWPRLCDVLFHLATGWDGWLRDTLGLDDPLDATVDGIVSWADLQGHRDRTRGWLRRVIDETPETDLLEANRPIRPDAPDSMRVTPAQILTHILLHERGHHGDITTMLSQLGATPPPTDYLIYVFFKQHQAAS